MEWPLNSKPRGMSHKWKSLVKTQIQILTRHIYKICFGCQKPLSMRQFGCSKELSDWDSIFENSQHMFPLTYKKHIVSYIFLTYHACLWIMSIWVLSDNSSYRTMSNNHWFLALNISQGQIEGSWAPITLSRHQQHQCDASLSRPMLWIAENLSLPGRKHSLRVELTIFNFNTLKHLSSRLVFKGGFSHVQQPRMHWQLPFIYRVAWFCVLESWVNWRNLIKVLTDCIGLPYICACVCLYQ